MGKNKWISLKFPDEYRNQVNQINSIIKSKLGDKYDQMDINMLHMTAVFLGDKFNKIDLANEVMATHANTEFRLEFEEATVFPPDKKNLIVLKFKNNNTLKNVVADMKNKFNVNEERFTAHITLGKLSISKHDTSDFNKLLNETLSEINKMNNINFRTSGFYLCGL